MLKHLATFSDLSTSAIPILQNKKIKRLKDIEKLAQGPLLTGKCPVLISGSVRCILEITGEILKPTLYPIHIPDQLNQNTSYFYHFLPRCSCLSPKYPQPRLISWVPGSFLRQRSWAVGVENHCLTAPMHNYLPCPPSCPTSKLPPECSLPVLSKPHQDHATPGAPLCWCNEEDTSQWRIQTSTVWILICELPSLTLYLQPHRTLETSRTWHMLFAQPEVAFPAFLSPLPL